MHASTVISGYNSLNWRYDALKVQFVVVRQTPIRAVKRFVALGRIRRKREQFIFLIGPFNGSGIGSSRARSPPALRATVDYRAVARAALRPADAQRQAFVALDRERG